MSTIDYIILTIMVVVFVTMAAGIVVMAIGGKTNEKYSNKLMLLRVASQGLVIFLLGFMFMLSK